MNSGIAKRGKINSLQAVRALAFINILVLHCEGSASGACGVSIFLVLSGFLMMYSYYDRDLSYSLKDSITFSANKIKRLYPLHIIMMVLPMLFSLREIICEFTRKKLLDFIIQIVLNVTLLQAWVPVTEFYFSLNGVAWYLSTCMFIYAVFPFILCHFKKMKINKIIFVGIIVFVCQIIVCILLRCFKPFSNSYFFTYIFPIFRLGDFIIGCCLGYVFLNVDFKPNKIQATVIEFISLITVACSEVVHLKSIGVGGSYHFKYSVLFIPSSVAVVLTFAINKGFISKALACKPIVYIGNVSPYAFLIHRNIIIIVRIFMYKLILSRDSMWFKPILIVVSFGLTVLSSAVYIALEKKVKAYLNNKKAL